jgi:hypothetical protein
MSYSHRRSAVLFLHAAAALIVGGNAFANSDAVRSSRPVGVALSVTDQSPFFGLWELDLTRMPANYGPPPKRVTFMFEDIGSGKWRTKVEITAPDDSVRHIAIEYRRDGQAVQGGGDDADADTAAFNSPAPNVLIMGLAKHNRFGGVRVYTISGDGKEMTEAAAGADDKGVPFVRNFHFKRIR